ncbi:MAG: ATP-dependent RecD-like DNA helicase [Ruminococcus sp.]|nr:ATP-dependent RecD-like DNA helicase [Ruminococcus sp.]
MFEEHDSNTVYECTGVVESVIYRNEENGYTVIELSGDEAITAVGIMPMLNVGEEVKLTGTFKNHPSYGMQFSVVACEQSIPKSLSGILKYLSSGAIKGIGPATAQKLVKEYKERTIEILENEPERVAMMRGITLEKAREISRQIKMNTGVRELLVYFAGYDISPNCALSVYKALGNEAIERIKENPYILCNGDFNISFEKADKIAMAQDKPADSEYRIRAGLAYVLNHNMINGHTCLPKDTLVKVSADFLEISKELCLSILEEMLLDSSIANDEIGDKAFSFIPSVHRCEKFIAARINFICRYPADRIPDIDKRIKHIEDTENIQYADLQKKAINDALSKGMLVLTGGPGTGKTTTLNAIIRILKDCGKKVFLTAPTGRAAQRMSKVTGCEAKTIHRLLEVNFTKGEEMAFKHNEKNLLDCDALVVDEVSMVDIFLFESLMKALPLGCRLILVGDSNQLPSVGPGNVLEDIVSSNTIPVVALNEIFRQSMESLIVTNAHKIVNGEMPDLTKKDKDFFFLPCYNQYDISNIIVDLCKRRLPNSYGYSPFEDIQVLAPSKKGELGTTELNKKLQLALNPNTENAEEITVNGKNFRKGDKVMQIKNNYDINWYKENGETGAGIFNGDIGILESISKKSNIIKVIFDDKIAVYDSDSISDLDFAYACTVHKSQGNEFEAVIIPMHKGAPQLYYRNLLYTAVTRAKRLLILVGDKNTVEYMVNNNRRSKRYSGLKEFLIRCRNEQNI